MNHTPFDFCYLLLSDAKARAEVIENLHSQSKKRMELGKFIADFDFESQNVIVSYTEKRPKYTTCTMEMDGFLETLNFIEEKIPKQMKEER